MSQSINDNYKNNSPKALDADGSKFVSGRSVAFASLAEANTANLAAYRNDVEIIWVNVGGVAKPHAYRGGYADSNLVDISGWEIAATRSAISASTQPRTVWVTADENEGGNATQLFHNGTSLRLVQILV